MKPTTPRDPDIQVVEFPNARPTISDEEVLRRVKAEAERLANQTEIERAFFMERCADTLAIPLKTLKAAVNAVLKERSKRVAAERLQQDREHKRQHEQRTTEDRKEEQHAKEKERKQQQAEKKKEHERLQAELEAKRKEKEKQKAFGILAPQPVAQHAKELQRLAERLGEDVAALRKQFEAFIGVGGGDASGETTEPWPEPVQTATLLSEISNKTSRYVILQKHQLTAASLWTPHCWLYDHDVPIHSPILALTSAEPDSGKTTAIVAIGRACPRYSLNIEMTGPSLYRYVDRVKPTLMIDEADDLFARRSDLKHTVNAGWTKGAKIPRQVCIGGVWQTAYFDPFTPKAIALLGRNLPTATRTRCIELRMVPKRPDEKTEPFNQVDDPEFAILRRKCARWAQDNAAGLKDAKPTMPPGLNNRAAANWRMMLAIADLAGGTWPQRAREAAERLTRSGRRPSDGRQLLAAIKAMFAESGKSAILSEAIITNLCRDPTDIWIAYNRGGPVTQRQVAHLLGRDAYEIYPQPLHPTRRGNFARRGYKLEQFADAFARYLPSDPIIRSRSLKRTKVRRVKVKRRR
jgi:putative DNA primase/helicase